MTAPTTTIALLTSLLLLTTSACKKENTVNVGAGGAMSGTLPELPDCAAEAGAPPGSGGPQMVPVGRLDGACFWIDETEVTVAQYELFLATDPDGADQEATCEWNDSFEASDCIAPETTDTDPVTCVDWCDAQAYCQSVGKSLCRDDISRRADAEVSSWYSACSNGQRTDYPYGNEYRENLCNGPGFSTEVGLRPADVPAECASDDGVVNLIGNAGEWVDACDAQNGATDDCLVRGGSYKTSANALRCESPSENSRDTRRNDIGFRCCAHSD